MARFDEILRELDAVDLKVLRVIERYLPKFEYVPVELIEKRTGLPSSKLAKSFIKLTSMRLIRRRLGGLTGYTLTYLGLDALALSSLVARGVLASIGDKIGVGKEGDVYIALTPAGKKVVVKFHREGKSAFTNIRKYRSYAVELSRASWLLVAKAIGEREFKALLALHREGAQVPEPIAWNRHAVVQEYIDGVELHEIRELDEETASKLAKDILLTLRTAYLKVGIVHGDLSEYNILVTTGDEPSAYIIDWPQYVYRDEPHAEELLERDIKYVVNFFRKRAGLKLEPAKCLSFVKGEKDSYE